MGTKSRFRRLVAMSVVAGTSMVSFATGASADPPYEEDSSPPYSHDQIPDIDLDLGQAGGAEPDPDPGTGGTWTYVISTDSLKILGPHVDFGGSVWAPGLGIVSGAPAGPGTVDWGVDGGYYNARIHGTLHMEDATGQYARMHVGYFDSNGNFQGVIHGGTVQLSGTGHDSWSVDLSTPHGYHVTEVEVCTEISDDAITWDATCKRRSM